MCCWSPHLLLKIADRNNREVVAGGMVFPASGTEQRLLERQSYGTSLLFGRAAPQSAQGTISIEGVWFA